MRKFLAGQRPVVTTIAAATIAAFTAIPLYWFMNDSIPRVVYNIRVQNDPVTPGEPLQLTFTGDAFRICPARVQEELIDGNGIVFKVQERSGRIDMRPGPFSTTIDVPTPDAAAPGEAVYRSVVRYSCNPLQRLWPLVVNRQVEFTFAGEAEPASEDTPLMCPTR